MDNFWLKTWYKLLPLLIAVQQNKIVHWVKPQIKKDIELSEPYHLYICHLDNNSTKIFFSTIPSASSSISTQTTDKNDNKRNLTI